MRKYFVAAAKRVGADLLDFAVTEIADVVSGRENFKTAAKNVERQTLRKQLVSGSKKKGQVESFQQNLQNKLVVLFQGRHNHSENCITVKVSRRKQKIEIYLEHEGSGLAIFSTVLGHIFGSNVGNEFGVMLRGKGTHLPEFAYDIVRIHSLMIYTNSIEYHIVGDTKTPLLRCFPFFSKVKAGDIITTGQYMKYQTFSNLQFRPLLNNSSQSIQIDLRDTSGGKYPLYLSVSLAVF